MKTVGVIGGIGPESTIEYYRLLIAAYQTIHPDGTYPPIFINSVNMKNLVDFFQSNQLSSVTEFLVAEIKKLAQAGADLAVLAANTPHIVFDDIRQQSPIPMLSLVEATRDAAKRLRLNRLGLFGTRFTMQSNFYPQVFSPAQVELVVPHLDEQAYIHDKYFNELVKGILLPETRDQLLRIAQRLKNEEQIDGLILGGTELPLILGDVPDQGIPFLDTTRIHVQAVAALSWS
jgi:aspartate racemase